MYLGFSFSWDFHENIGQIFSGASAGALHVRVASMRVTMGSEQGIKPSGTTTCKTDIGCASEEPPKETWHMLLLEACS